nr:6-bladed beta-propeller [uncultured Draconibacterium sp.]
MLKNICLLIISILFIECSEHSINNTDTKSIKVFDNTIDQITTNDLITNVQYIPLETNSSCLIGRIDKMLISNDKLYILDKSSSKKLFVFELTGKFIQTIGEQGKGPQEYIQITDFSIDEAKDEIVLLDNNRNLLIYNLNGEFIKSKKLSKKNFFQNLCIYKHSYYLYTNNLKGNSDKYSIFTYDNNFDEKKLFYYSDHCDFLHPVDNPILHNKKGLYYLDIFNKVIYEKIKNEFEKKYLFDFDGNYTPLDIANSSELFFQNYSEHCLLQRYVVGDRYIYIQILNKAKYNVGIIDMDKDSFILYKKISSEKIAFRPPHCYYNSKFYSTIEPGIVLDNPNSFKHLIDKQLINANSNPIIFNYKFRSDD